MSPIYSLVSKKILRPEMNTDRFNSRSFHRVELTSGLAITSRVSMTAGGLNIKAYVGSSVKVIMIDYRFAK